MQTHLNNGRKVDATRVISQKAGVSLKEAKNFVEAVQDGRA
jgi:ribosomal protein L7/L12